MVTAPGMLSTCQVAPPSAEWTTVPRVPLAQITRSLTTDSPRKEALVSTLSSSQVACALADEAHRPAKPINRNRLGMTGNLRPRPGRGNRSAFAALRFALRSLAFLHMPSLLRTRFLVVGS